MRELPECRQCCGIDQTEPPSLLVKHWLHGDLKLSGWNHSIRCTSNTEEALIKWNDHAMTSETMKGIQ